jgi:molecular chaperone DnaK
VEAEAVGRVVFVGGPTLTPLVRQRVGDAFGGRVAEGIDPMTAVARGAALFAATAGLDARPRVVAPPAKGLGLRIEHPAVTADVEPFVAGRFLPAPGEALPATVRVEREDGGFATGEVAVSAEGGFVAQVKLERGKQGRFKVRAFDSAGHEIVLRSPGLSIVHGMSVADPPLSRTVGVALADDTVHVYFAKGTPLPARRSFVHQTVQAVPAGDGDVLCIPVVQGEFERAHRNRLIGTLQVSGVSRALPAGSRVEVTLRLDRSGQLEARADIPTLGQTFDDVVQVLVPTASPEVLAREVAAAELRIAELRRRSAQKTSPEIVMWLGVATPLLAEASAGLEAAQGGDADAAQRTARLLLDLGAALDSVEQELAWPELDAEADDAVRLAVPWVAAFGTKNEQKLFEEALEAVRAARKAREAAELERQLRVVRAMGDAAFSRDPRTPHLEFDWYASNVGEALDLPRAAALVARGREARARDDASEMRSINRQLSDLFPSSPEARRRSFGSGVR